MESVFPPFIHALPRPDSPFDIDARIVPSEHAMTMFYAVDEDVEIPEHVHGAQWGVVLEGSMEMEMDGIMSRYGKGDVYYVPPGVRHVTRIAKGYQGIDVFRDAHRYQPLPD